MTDTVSTNSGAAFPALAAPMVRLEVGELAGVQEDVRRLTWCSSDADSGARREEVRALVAGRTARSDDHSAPTIAVARSMSPTRCAEPDHRGALRHTAQHSLAPADLRAQQGPAEDPAEARSTAATARCDAFGAAGQRAYDQVVKLRFFIDPETATTRESCWVRRERAGIFAWSTYQIHCPALSSSSRRSTLARRPSTPCVAGAGGNHNHCSISARLGCRPSAPSARVLRGAIRRSGRCRGRSCLREHYPDCDGSAHRPRARDS